MNKKQIGRLAFAGQITPELVKASCSCGFPSVIVSADDWQKGAVLGCAACHVAELTAREAEAAQEAREREMERREANRQAQAHDLYVAPHFDDLAPRQRRLFRALSEESSFDVMSVAKLLRVTPEEAWQELRALLEANVLLERVGVMGEIRPYSQHEAYEMRAQKESTYSCRGTAVKHMREDEARVVAQTTAPVDAQPVSPEQLEAVRQFIAAHCIADADAAESEVLLRSRYCGWCGALGRDALEPDQFREALTLAGVPLRNGKRRGVRLKTAREIQAAAAS